jgi:hypothetical protein
LRYSCPKHHQLRANQSQVSGEVGPGRLLGPAGQPDGEDPGRLAFELNGIILAADANFVRP